MTEFRATDGANWKRGDPVSAVRGSCTRCEERELTDGAPSLEQPCHLARGLREPDEETPRLKFTAGFPAEKISQIIWAVLVGATNAGWAAMLSAGRRLVTSNSIQSCSHWKPLRYRLPMRID